MDKTTLQNDNTVKSSGASFFADLPAVSTLTDISNPRLFRPTPPEWIVVSSDIRDSTSAVQSGRYKEVNMAAGCVVSAVLNSTNIKTLPFVFGGDGATILIPPVYREKIKIELDGTRKMIANEFDLDMRIGLIPIDDIRKAGFDIYVARYQLSEGNNTALFKGGGMEYAEQLIKDESKSPDYLIPNQEVTVSPDLEGLSCRWEPLKSANGLMICILVKPRNPEDQTLSQIVSKIAQIVGGSLNYCSPVSDENMHFHWPPRGLKMEAKVTKGKKGFYTRYFQVLVSSLVQFLLEKFDLKRGTYDAPAYREELKTNSDYCRLDDSLRMILDCSNKQAKEIENLLTSLHQQKVIDFGYFETQEALMTCLVDDLSTHQHLHFIDGADGGFWSAAKDLKARDHR